MPASAVVVLGVRLGVTFLRCRSPAGATRAPYPGRKAGYKKPVAIPAFLWDNRIPQGCNFPGLYLAEQGYKRGAVRAPPRLPELRVPLSVAMDTSFPREERPPPKRGPPPALRDHLVWAIFNTLYMNFCCLGFVALAFAIKVRHRSVRRLRESLPSPREGCPRRHRALGITPGGLGRADPNTLRRRLTPAAAGESSPLFLLLIPEVVAQTWTATDPCPPPEELLLYPKKMPWGAGCLHPPGRSRSSCGKMGARRDQNPHEEAGGKIPAPAGLDWDKKMGTGRERLESVRLWMKQVGKDAGLEGGRSSLGWRDG